MICLACGHENDYGSGRCERCAEEWVLFAPFVNANHVSQLQQALRRCLEGQLDLEGLGERYGRFAEMAMDFQSRWGGERLLSERLASELQPTYGQAVADLDRSLASLEEALGCIDDALESGDLALLTAADEQLTDFFKIGLGGCAALIEELEKVGESHNFGSFLDVRGL